MLTANKRQPSGRVYWWTLAALVLVFGSLLFYRGTARERFVGDPLLLRDLESASFAAAPPPSTRPSQWPQWRGPNRDGVSTETGLLTAWPAEGPKVLWKAKAGDGYSSLVVDAGRAYTLLQDGEDEAVVCWDAETGKESWRLGYACKYHNDYGSGPRSTPTVDGEYVYTVGATGILHCLKAASGEKVWRHNLLEEFQAENLTWGVSFSPLIEGELILTNPGGPNGSSLVAFDKRTGQLVWKGQNDQAGYSSPLAITAAGVRQVVFFTESGLVSVSPKDGQVYWRFPWETDYGCNIATPISAGDYLYISSGYGRGCALVKIVADESGALQAKRVYENNLMCNHFSSSVLFQDHLYGFNEATLTCMEFRTGKVVWKEKGFRKGSLLVADGQLIILGESGQLALAEATPEGYRQKASFRISQNKCWTVPALANGKLFVRDEEQVLCLDLKKTRNDER
jgi:outer membrane protein assembly factor BamB